MKKQVLTLINLLLPLSAWLLFTSTTSSNWSSTGERNFFTTTSMGFTLCTGILSGTHDDILVEGGNCTLQNATINGSVMVNNGGKLTVSGGTTINGSIQAENGGNINVNSGTVLGDVSLKNSNNITVGSGANINSLKLEKSGKITASGNIGDIEAKESKAILLNGAIIFPGGIAMEKGSGSLTVQNATIEGSIKVVETDGTIAVNSGSQFEGSITIEKGKGKVNLEGTTFASGDLIVVEQEGNITAQNSTFSDIKVEKSKGKIILRNLITDSDTFIGENDGDVVIENSSFTGDVEIKSNQAVKVKQNSFSLEDISISNNNGLVRIINNKDLGLSVTENKNVIIKNNTVTSLEVSKNSGSVTINNNRGEELGCADNSSLNCSGNSFQEATGQCANCSNSGLTVATSNSSIIHYSGRPAVFYFNASLEMAAIKLHWVSDLDKDVVNYILERSADGVTFEPIFEKISALQIDHQVNVYQHIDFHPFPNNNYYRLQLQYNNGAVAYSDVQKVIYEIDPSDFTLFPNPVSNQLHIHTKMFAGKSARLEMTNPYGQILWEKQEASLPETYLTVNLEDWQDGMYIISIKVEGHRLLSKKFFIAKP